MKFIQNIDDFILNFVQANIRNPIMDSIMKFTTFLGNGGLIWILIALVLIFTKKYRKYGYAVIISLLMCSLVGDGILKHMVGRIRPYKLNESIKLLISPPKGFSFPSGHTMSSFAAAMVIFKAKKRFGIVAFITAVLIGFSRLYLYVHYPSDVFIGAILGLTIGFFVCEILTISRKYNGY